MYLDVILSSLIMITGASAACAPQSAEATFARNAFAQSDIAAIGSGRRDGDGLLYSFYPNTTVSMKLGNIVASYGTAVGSPQTANPPHILLQPEPCTEYAKSKYLMMLLDVDAPDPSVRGPFASKVQWVVYNVSPGVDVLSQLGSYQGAKVLATYQRPTFKTGSVAYHRFALLVFRHPPNFVSPKEPHFTGDRSGFDVEAYLNKADLYNSLVAGNYFRERWSYCDHGLCNWTGIGTYYKDN